MRALAGFFVVVTLVACNKPTAPPPPPPTTTAPTPPTTKQNEHGFVEDDADAAFAAAKAAGKLVFVDAWAPWCHTCLSMQRDVLSKPAFTAFGDRLVFLAVDTDRPENANFVERFRVRVWPTFFVVDPNSDAPLAVHPGSMALDETVAFLNEALKARDPEAQKDPLLRALLAGHQALAKNDMTTASKHYAIAAAADWPRRSEAIISGLRAFSASDDVAGCLEFGDKYAGAVKGGGERGDAVSYLMACADKLTDAAKKKETQLGLKTRLQELVDKPAEDASVDDKADVLANLADLAEELGDKEAGKALHEQRLKMLEDDAAKQTTPVAQQVHDYARMNSLVALGRGDDAVKLFQQRTQERPDDYEPWARLGSTLHKLGRDDEAKGALEKAIALSYGTRRLRYLAALADVDDARKDSEGARVARQTLVDDGEKLPAVLRDDKLIAAAKAKLPPPPMTTTTTKP